VLARGTTARSSVAAAAAAAKNSSAADRYTIMYDDGIVTEAVPRNSMRPLAKRPVPAAPAAAPGRQLAFALGRMAPPSADEGHTNPAALSRVFKSFLRKGEDAVPIRYELSEDGGDVVTTPSSGTSPLKYCSQLKSCTDTCAASSPSHARAFGLGGLECVDGEEYLEGVAVYAPPLIEVAYAVDPRDPSAVAVNTSTKPHTWHAVAMSSQLRSLYHISDGDTSVRKAERDSYVDAIRINTPLTSGVHRFRVRIDETAGEDFCNHIGFVAGDGYKGSALNSAGTMHMY
jgi:hypothetical protein